MFKDIFRLCAGLLLLFVLTACGNTPASVSRDSDIEVSLPNAGLSELSKQFRLQTPYVVNFEFDRFELTQEAEKKLDIQANWIIRHPSVRFRVYGHTDKVGNVAYNMALGLRRANEVVEYFTEKGIDPSRLEVMVSFGEEFPVINTEERELLNRRAMTDVIGFVVPTNTVNDGLSGEALLVASSNTPTFGTAGGTDTATGDDTAGDSTDEGSNGGGSQSNSGRGNGDEESDPGNSGGHNKGGDEV